MDNDSPFPFRTIKEAWDYFTKAARMHFAKLIREVAKESPEVRQKVKFLPNKDYCARLLYILNMFAFEGDHEGEFDLDWAMLIAKPLSASQARKSIDCLIDLGLLGEIEVDDFQAFKAGAREDETDGEFVSSDEDLSRRADERRRTPPNRKGGDVSAHTQFNFDSEIEEEDKGSV
jgi:hypothetical protein